MANPPILIRRALAATPIATPAPGLDGEFRFARGGFTDAPDHVAAGNDLVITDGGITRTVVGPARQVELIGDQVVGGRKTFSLASFSLTGGTAGYVLSTDGAGLLSFIPPAAGGGGGIAAVNHDTTMTGDGDAVPLSVVPATATQRGAVIVRGVILSGLTLTPATGDLLLAFATRVQYGGTTFASETELDTGAIDNKSISPLSLRAEMGAAASALATAARTVIPAINELKTAIDALTGQLVLAGAYNPVLGLVTPSGIAGNPFVLGPLPAPIPAMTGLYLIVVASADMPGPMPPAGVYAPGDWLVVDGAPAYLHISLGKSDTFVDGISIIGDGFSPATAFEVGIIDGGNF